ncbi:MAG: MFS transporter [Rickettsiales bacterium]
MHSIRLLLSRRFGPMFTTMALGAFNDNFFKNALIILVTYSLAKQIGMNPATLISIASAFFIIPFFLCSGLAGELADRMPKNRLVRILKVTELVLMVFAAAALITKVTWALLLILFLIGMQAAFFSPAKYAVLPELVAKEELLVANGLIEAGTFFCILFGTLLGGLLILDPVGTELVSALLVVIAAIGVYAAWRVPETATAQPDMKINYNILQSTWRMVLHAFADRNLMLPILGISWFWAIGSTFLGQIPVFAKDILGADEKVVTLFNGIFTIGIALGSFACAWISKRLAAHNLSAMALFGVFAFGLDVCWLGYHAPKPNPEELIGLITYLTASAHHLRLALDLFLMAFSGGVFIVPLYTKLQMESAEHERARTIASNNVVNALFVAVTSLSASVLFANHFTVLQVLLMFSLLNVPIIWLMARPARRHTTP